MSTFSQTGAGVMCLCLNWCLALEEKLVPAVVQDCFDAFQPKWIKKNKFKYKTANVIDNKEYKQINKQ